MAQNEMNIPIESILIVGFVAFMFVGILGFGFIHTVDEGERAVKTFGGAMTTDLGNPIGSGYELTIPIVESLHKYDVKVRSYDMSGPKESNQFNWRDMEGYQINGKTQNEMNMYMDMTVKYRINESKVPYIYANIGDAEKMLTDVLRPTVRSSIRDEMSEWTRGEIVEANRTDFKDGARERMEQQLGEFGIQFVGLDIRDIQYPESVEEQVNQKEAEKERQLKKEEEIETAKLEAERKVEQAQGQAEANRVLANSIDQRLIMWRYVKALQENPNTVFIGGDSPIMTNDVGQYNISGSSGQMDYGQFTNTTVEAE